MQTFALFCEKEGIAFAKDLSLTKRSSIKIGGKADYAAYPAKEQIPIMTDYIRKNGIQQVLAGGLTNLLISDSGFRGVFVFFDKISKIRCEHDSIVADAGVRLPVLSKCAAECGLSGLEELSGIPGTVGGALYQNAGAFGSEFGDAVLCATVYDAEEKKTVIMSQSEMDFAYRHSIFATKRFAILDVTLRLVPSERQKIEASMSHYRKIRREKQPVGIPSLGSFFRRTEKGSAGLLIDRAGLKGARIGDAAISEKHAGFLVNLGNATADDVSALSERVRHEIEKRDSVRLTEEIERIGF